MGGNFPAMAECSGESGGEKKVGTGRGSPSDCTGGCLGCRGHFREDVFPAIAGPAGKGRTPPEAVVSDPGQKERDR